MSHLSRSPWLLPGWIEEARRWIRDLVAQEGLRLTGPLEQVHLRPWSTVYRVPSNAGVYYFKAATPALSHEAALTEILAGLWPKSLPRVIAADRDRGWLLLDDGGIKLREVLKSEGDLRHWLSILPVYARLQRSLAGRRELILSAGVLDRRLAVLPSRYAALLRESAFLGLDRSEGLTAVEHSRLRSLVPTLADACSALGRYPVPETLDHGDFHGGNIFLKNGRYLFFDWGDCSLTHPFFSLRTVVVSIENTLDLDADSPWLTRLVNAYLTEWDTGGDRGWLQEAYALSRQLAPIIAALRWWQAMAAVDDLDASGYGRAIPSLLREFLVLNDQC